MTVPMTLKCVPGTTRYCSRWLAGLKCIKGEACTFPYECTTGACDAGTCATNRMCVGG